MWLISMPNPHRIETSLSHFGPLCFLSNYECISSVLPSKTSKLFNVNKTYPLVESRPVNQISIRR